MDRNQKLLRIAAILNLISSSIVFFSTYSFIGIISAIIFLYFSKLTEEELKNNKVGLILLTITQIIINFVACILSFIVISSINKEDQVIHPTNGPPVRIKRVVDPEFRKIDILLKLGVGMVFISGILFATTSWEFVSDAAKSIALLLFGSIFLGLSYLSERKFNLYKSSYMYWILSMSFYFLSVVALLYFNVFGHLSYEGVDFKLAYAITCFTAAGLCYATYLKFPKEYLLYGFYGCIFLVLYNFLAYFPIDPAIVMIILSTVLLGTSIIAKKESVLYQVAKILAMIMFIYIIRSIHLDNEIFVLIASFINIGNLGYILMDQDDVESIFTFIFFFYLYLIICIYL